MIRLFVAASWKDVAIPDEQAAILEHLADGDGQGIRDRVHSSLLRAVQRRENITADLLETVGFGGAHIAHPWFVSQNVS